MYKKVGSKSMTTLTIAVNVMLFISFCYIFFLFSDIFTLRAEAKAVSLLDNTIDAGDFYTEVSELEKDKVTAQFLRDNGYVNRDVTDEELDYILVLTGQLASQYDNIDRELILAMIAHESRFNANAKSSYGARGLMQLLPVYHDSRLIQFLEEDEQYYRDMFYDPRLNIMTGCDYISYILTETKGNVVYALMWYNMGATKACEMYEHGVSTSYANNVVALAEELRELN